MRTPGRRRGRRRGRRARAEPATRTSTARGRRAGRPPRRRRAAGARPPGSGGVPRELRGRRAGGRARRRRASGASAAPDDPDRDRAAPHGPDRGPREPILPPYEQSRPGGALSKGAPASDGFFSSRRRALLVMGGTVLGIAGARVRRAAAHGRGRRGRRHRAGARTAARRRRPTSPQRSQAARRDRSRRGHAWRCSTAPPCPAWRARSATSIERQGFQLGTVTNFIDQQRAESVVQVRARGRARGGRRRAAAEDLAARADRRREPGPGRRRHRGRGRRAPTRPSQALRPQA